MCGIAGYLALDGEQADAEVVVRMTRAVAHRGPDGEGLWTSGPVAFGHRRLAVRDLSEAGRQPMLDAAAEICVTYNGEIYNDRALREQIARQCGYRFRSSCDTEILPIGWRLWGEALFDRLEGMFAVALWDGRDGSLVLARDGVGIKPLFYAEHDGRLYFASEIKGILAAGAFRPSLDYRAFHEYLASGYTAPDSSLAAEVRQVPPGSLIRLRPGERTARRFWAPRRAPTHTDEREAVELLQSTFEQVAIDMRASDVPMGLMLSSGIDSTVIALSGAPGLPCFTASFREASHDESAAAQRVAALSGNEWSQVTVDDQTDLAGDFEAMVHHLDGQLADSSALAHFGISRAIAQKVKVALAGDGADEFFGGYPTYRASLLAARIEGIAPKRAARAVAEGISRVFGGADESRVPWHEKLVRFLRGLSTSYGDPHPEWRRIAFDSVLPGLYAPRMQWLLSEDPLLAYRRQVREARGELIDRCLLADQTYYLPADMLVKVDRMSMAHGLEIRVPFLDRRVMDLAGSMHSALLLGPSGTTKRVLRSLAQTLGAPDDLVRAGKKGFNVPVAGLLRGPLRRLSDHYFHRDLSVFEPMLAPDRVRALWREHAERRRNHGYLLWALLTWGVWQERQSLST